MNAAEANLLREFADEARLRSRRTKCPEERQAAEKLEGKFRLMIKEIETTDSNKDMSPSTH